MNGLGFLSAPLYIFEEFFVGKATEHLIGKGVWPEHLNDDRLGRALISAEKIKAGRFILATNILDKNEVSNQQVLEEYKDQQSNERGFRFLKDPLFFTANVFVKNPQRVEAIAMVMGLCLLVYNLAQRKLRQQLESANESIRNQVNKLTNKPTMRWIFQMFQAVHLVTLNGEEQVSNLTSERQQILNYLGKVCGQYYLRAEAG